MQYRVVKTWTITIAQALYPLGLVNLVGKNGLAMDKYGVHMHVIRDVGLLPLLLNEPLNLRPAIGNLTPVFLSDSAAPTWMVQDTRRKWRLFRVISTKHPPWKCEEINCVL